ncbi:MAG: TonB-dependent receptor [Dysgonamonadaceae bacterium]|jgi:TonB-linked SusC/RagA family outer membrane protein|nr:TonB-dependent receptor [Dysgonamonadaceae bacterium]
MMNLNTKKRKTINWSNMRKLLFSVCISVCTFSLFAQNVTVTGVVKDDTGEPLPGVTVSLRGTTRGVITDLDGSFSIGNLTPASVLDISFIGFETFTLTVGNQRKVDVTLQSKTDELDEVTIVAFGKQKKSSVVSSIETVKISDLKIPASNLTNALAGRIPGVISYQTSGEPGADNAQFFVRGVTTFGYKSDPLILIDGFEATSNDLARIQPDDIESFSVLKDASATVLYGARGANGIIMVNTKGGREGTAKINARVDVHVAAPTRMNELLDGVSYMRLYNEAYASRNPGTSAYYSEQKIQSTLQGENRMVYPNTDWYDVLFNKQTINTKANLNVSGGGKEATYYVAGGFDNESGLLKMDKRNNFNNNIDINRFHIRSNVIFKLTSTTMLDTRIQGRFETYTGPYNQASDIFRMVMNSNPVDFPAVYEPDVANIFTDHTLFGSLYTASGLKQNAYAEMVKGYEDRNESTITAQATLMQDLSAITEGLKIQAKVSANTWSYYSAKRKFDPYYYDVAYYNQITGMYYLFALNPTGGKSFLGDVEPKRDASAHYYFEARLNWDRKFGKHSVGAMTVGIAEEYQLTSGNSGDIYETLPERNIGNSGRLTYDYDSRYFLEFAYGYNGSEKFTGSKQFGFFPSLGLGWLISNESFWKPMKNSIGLLKLKASRGLVGNDAIAGRKDRFFFLSNIAIGGAGYRWGNTFQNTYSGYTISRYANPDITWEVSDKYNLGMEVGFFRDESLKFQIDVFRDTRSNIYWPRENYPSTAGFEAKISGNVGEVESQGIDASLDFQHFFNNDFWMTGRANFTYATNKIIEMDEPNYPDEYLKKAGRNLSQPEGLIAERLFIDQAEINNSPTQGFGPLMAGDIKYKDVNNDGKITDNDRVPMGYPTTPEIQYGFGLSTGYGKWDFSFFFQGNARVSFFIDPRGTRWENEQWKYGIAPFVDQRNALKIIADDHWSETNPNVHAFWPRLSTTLIENNVQTSSWWLRNGSFLRMKTIELGYNLSGIKAIHLQSSRIYCSAENLFVISAFKLWDPEMGSNGLGYPINRRFNVGIQLSF